MKVVCKAHIEVDGKTAEVHLSKSATTERYFWKHDGLPILLTRPHAETPAVALDNLRVDYPSATLTRGILGVLTTI